MFQHRGTPADNILTQAMRITELDRLLPMSYGMTCSLPGGKERRPESANSAGLPPPNGYDSSSMFQLTAADFNNPCPPFVILPRADLDFIKQEIVGLKQSIVQFQNVMTTEMQKLRVESQALKRQVESQRCGCRGHGYGGGKELNGVGGDKTASSWQQAWQGPPVGTPSIDCSTPSLSQTTASMNQSPCILNLSDHNNTSSSTGAGFLQSTSQQLNSNNSSSSPTYSSCQANSESRCAQEQKPLVQLLPNYNVYVNKLTLQIVVNEAQSHKDTGAIYVLRRIIPLVFTWEELASSRGQGLNCKSTSNVGNKYPLDPTKVMACKAYMRKFCVEFDCLEPTEKSINQTFNHQVNYSRRRVRGVVSHSRPRNSATSNHRSGGRRTILNNGALHNEQQALLNSRQHCTNNNSLSAGTVSNIANNYLQM